MIIAMFGFSKLRKKYLLFVENFVRRLLWPISFFVWIVRECFSSMISLRNINGVSYIVPQLLPCIELGYYWHLAQNGVDAPLCGIEVQAFSPFWLPIYKKNTCDVDHVVDVIWHGAASVEYYDCV